MSSIATLQDLFNQTSLNTGLWSQFTAGSATLSYASTGAQVNFPASTTSSTDGDLSSATTYDLTSSAAFLHVITVPSSSSATDAELRLQINSSNYLRWVYESGTLYAQYNVAGTRTTAFSVAYSAATHAYWRIRESGGTIFWDTSTDGSTYTNRASVANPITVTALTVLLAGIGTRNDTSPGSYKWNNFNVIPGSGGGGGSSNGSLMMMGVGI